MPRNNAPTTRGRPFQRGNPGRPRGSKHKTTVACEELLAGEGERLTRKAITLALKANTIALKLCLDRIVPIRGARLKLDVPHIETPADVMQALGAVMKAASSGVISAEEASQLASIIGHQRQALELGELAARVTALETAEAQRGDA